jgi:hypothetical protein
LANSFEVLDAGLLTFQIEVTADPERVRAQLLVQVLNRLADPLALPFKFGCINNDILDPTSPEATQAFKVCFFSFVGAVRGCR